MPAGVRCSVRHDGWRWVALRVSAWQRLHTRGLCGLSAPAETRGDGRFTFAYLPCVVDDGVAVCHLQKAVCTVAWRDKRVLRAASWGGASRRRSVHYAYCFVQARSQAHQDLHAVADALWRCVLKRMVWRTPDAWHFSALSGPRPSRENVLSTSERLASSHVCVCPLGCRPGRVRHAFTA